MLAIAKLPSRGSSRRTGKDYSFWGPTSSYPELVENGYRSLDSPMPRTNNSKGHRSRTGPQSIEEGTQVLKGLAFSIRP